jgi:hypothetical protein
VDSLGTVIRLHGGLYTTGTVGHGLCIGSNSITKGSMCQ